MSPEALLRAPELFDQSLETIVSELLQNARRAGATVVNITIGQNADGEPLARFEDDGAGIDDLQALVSFGRTAWGDSVRRSEDTAGMGAYCLASRGCRVTSRGRSAVLNPNVFVGLESAPIQQAAHRQGTVIEFLLRKDPSGLAADEVETLSRAIGSECLYSPIPVSFGGRPVGRLPFLEHAVEVRVIDGVAIGIYSRKAWALRTHPAPLTTEQRRSGEDYGLSHLAGPYGDDGLVNFGGHVAKTPERVRVRDGDTELTALWEVRDNPRLRLLLPTRDRVIEDDAWRDLVKATRLALCEHALRKPSHRLAMQDVRLARENGIAAPDPALVLSRWKPSAEKTLMPKPIRHPNGDIFDSRGRASGERALGCAIVPRSWPPHARHALFAAIRRMNPAPNFAAEDPALDGLPAYDGLPRVIGLDLKVAHYDGSQHRINDFQREDAGRGKVPPPDQIADLCWDEDGGRLAARLIGVTIRSARLRDSADPSGHKAPTIHGPVRLPVVVSGDGTAGAIAFLASKALTAANLDDCAMEIAACTFDEEYNAGQTFNTPATWLRDVREQLMRRTSEGASVKLDELISTIADQFAHLDLQAPDNPVQSIEIVVDPDWDWPDCPFTITVTGVDGTVMTAADATDDDVDWDWIEPGPGET